MPALGKTFALLMLSAATSLSLPARSVSVDLPGVSAFPDTEATTNVVMAAWDGSMRFLDFTLEFNVSPSNCFMVAFGHDSDHSGELSAGETGMTVGWDCGNWVVENAKTGDTYIETNSVPSGVRSVISFPDFALAGGARIGYTTSIPRGACAAREHSPENGNPTGRSICCTTATLSFSEIW